MPRPATAPTTWSASSREGDGGRTGYCEQFASAMAVMARAAGIPARVAVGFLEPEQIDDQTWEYTAWDLHAWPELFFPGSGWVRFEPTPSRRASGVPDYTTEEIANPGGPSGPSNSATDDLLPSRGPTATAAAAGPRGRGRRPAGRCGLPVVAGGRRHRRPAWPPSPGCWSRGPCADGAPDARVDAGPEAAWAELRDTAIDLRVPWPEGRSPRETRDRLVDYLGAPVDRETPERPRHGADVAPEAVLALDRIVLSLERLRYARDDAASDDDQLRADLQTVVASLYGGATRRARRRAEWWPRSVVGRQRTTRRTTTVAAPITVPHGAVVDHVG